jgi:hypothetical protein
VIEHLQRAGGASLAGSIEAAGWLPHTTRAALIGLRKRGYAVIRERNGAGGSVYRISSEAPDKENLTVLQPGAMHGRRPKRKAMEAA